MPNEEFKRAVFEQLGELDGAAREMAEAVGLPASQRFAILEAMAPTFEQALKNQLEETRSVSNADAREISSEKRERELNKKIERATNRLTRLSDRNHQWLAAAHPDWTPPQWLHENEAEISRLEAEIGSLREQLRMVQESIGRVAESGFTELDAIESLARIRALTTLVLPKLASIVDQLWPVVELSLSIPELASLALTGKRPAGALGAGLLSRQEPDVQDILRVASLFAWAESQTDQIAEAHSRFLIEADRRKVPRGLALAARQALIAALGPPNGTAEPGGQA